MTIINSATQYYLLKNSWYDENEDPTLTVYHVEYTLRQDSLNGPYSIVKRKSSPASGTEFRYGTNNLGFTDSAENTFNALSYLFEQINVKSIMTHQNGYIYDLLTDYYKDCFEYRSSGYVNLGFFTGDLVVSPPLNMVNKKAYLADFPVSFADDDDYKQCMLDLLNIIGSCLYNLYFKQNIYNSDVILDFSELIPELQAIVNALDTQSSPPIIINTEHDEPWSHV